MTEAPVATRVAAGFILAALLVLSSATSASISVLTRSPTSATTATLGVHPFGGGVTGNLTFHGLAAPSSGRMGWFYFTEQWEDGEFFRYEIADISPYGLVSPQ